MIGKRDGPPEENSGIKFQNLVPKPATYYTNGFQSTQRGVKMCIISVSITQALLVVATDPGIIY